MANLTKQIDLSPADLDLRVREGNRLTQQVFLREDGTAIDITGWTLEAQIKPDGESVVDITVTVNDAATGDITVSATVAEMTFSTPGGDHYWHLTRTDSGYEDTWAAGRVIVELNPVQ